MAEPQSTTALAPVAGSYQLSVKDFDAAGVPQVTTIPFPKDERYANVLFRAVLLKRTTWKQAELPMVILATIYADSLGLDIMAGDVYMAEEGRFSTTADAKIKHALASGRIRGYHYETKAGPPIEIPWETQKKTGVYKGPNFETIVTVKVEGWDEPLIYTARLNEWFTGRNPNWRERPAYMLEKNAISKALTLVAPMGVEADEAPTVESEAKVGASKAVAELKSAQEKEKTDVAHQ